MEKRVKMRRWQTITAVCQRGFTGIGVESNHQPSGRGAPERGAITPPMPGAFGEEVRQSSVVRGIG